MASFQSASASPVHLPFSSRRRVHPPRSIFIFPRNPHRAPSKFLSFLLRSSPNPPPTSDQDILQLLSGSNGQAPKNPPAVRSYENDLSRLTVVGAVSLEQALTAAAADGGKAADEHISSGVSTMVVETIFPRRPEEHSSIATRLFLSAKKVKEKAYKLRSSLTADMLASSTSENILAMTFRQVVLAKMWSFELVVFCTGTRRNMEELGDPRQVQPYITLSSSDERVLLALAEALCCCALRSTEEDFLGYSKNSKALFSWFRKPECVNSSDSSVCIYKMADYEIVQNAKNAVGKSVDQGTYEDGEKKPMINWWQTPAYSSLVKTGGPEFSALASEFAAAYRLQIDGNKFADAKFQGWNKLTDNRWEVLLTHMQMIALADIIDMYYEDKYTLPDKCLSSGLIVELPKLSKSKRMSTWLKIFPIAFSIGGLLILISILGQLFWPHLFKERESRGQHSTVAVFEAEHYKHPSLENDEVEYLCRVVISQIKEPLGWSERIMFDPQIGAWTGELPSYLKRTNNIDPLEQPACSGDALDVVSSFGDAATHEPLLSSVGRPSNESNTVPETAAAQDIASYQVTLSKDGRIVGFMPTSRVAVNHWVDNPLSRSLYKGRTLSPGLVEPGLKIKCPDVVIELELLMSVNPAWRFALARPVQ